MLQGEPKSTQKAFLSIRMCVSRLTSKWIGKSEEKRGWLFGRSRIWTSKAAKAKARLMLIAKLQEKNHDGLTRLLHILHMCRTHTLTPM